MKILGFDISFGNKVIKDAIPDIEKIDPGTISPADIPKIQSPLFIHTQSHVGHVSKPSQRRGVFEPAEYDLYEIGRIEDVDSYVRQAFKKKTGLALKEGFHYIGKNKRAVKYIRTRFSQIAQATALPHEELIRRLIRSFITRSNAFLIKVRKEQASGGKIRIDNTGKRLNPIAGYFVAPPETMQVDVDGSGKPKEWRQQLPNGQSVTFRPEDVVHFTFDRKEGFLFGTPTLIPVIDDIRALRKIEENIELLIYKHLFPLFQYIVGTETAPASFTEDGMSEIEVIKQEIQYMPTEGGIVTPERHKIEAIGAEGRALRAENYILHFKQRVFAGLGMSAVDYGESDSSNRSTADTMSRALVDDVKDFQDAFEAQFNEYVINELLLESTFEEDMLLEENKVKLQFKEIDIAQKIKIESHAADLFTKHAFTWDELRQNIGLDVIQVPDDPEDQDPTSFPEWHRTFWKLFDEPKTLINAGDEPYSVAAQAAAEARSAAVTNKNISASQNIAKSLQPKKTTKDNFLLSDYEDIRSTLVHEVSFEQVNLDNAMAKVKLIADSMSVKLRSHMMAAFVEGLTSDIATNNISLVNKTRREIHDRAFILSNRLTKDIINQLSKRIDTSSSSDRISMVNLVLDTLRYRVDLIVNTETIRAKNLGLISKATIMGAISGKYSVSEETCQSCKEKSNHNNYFYGYTIDNVPPHHPNCNCGLIVTEVKNV